MFEKKASEVTQETGTASPVDKVSSSDPGKLEPNKELYLKELETLKEFLGKELFERKEAAEVLGLDDEGSPQDIKVPAVMFAFHHRKNSAGYVARDRWEKGDIRIAEIGLNASILRLWSFEEVAKLLSVKLGEVMQLRYGKPSRPGYANRELVSLLVRVGLSPMSGPDGKPQNGERLDWQIVPDGLFEKALRKLEKRNFGFSWREAELEEGPKPKVGKSGQRVKYVCPEDPEHLALWGREGLEDVGCRKHDVALVLERDLAEQASQAGEGR